jgi:hypothetical protein
MYTAEERALFLLPPDDFVWPAPWRPVTYEREQQVFSGTPANEIRRHTPGHSWVVELKSEVCPGHVLYGGTYRALAWATDNGDDYIFVTNVPGFPIVFVHLTWGVEDTHTTFPFTVGYPSWEAFLREWSGGAS